jgi:hypothetical protein
MSFKSLADSFSGTKTLPIQVNSVLDWIRANTDFKNIKLHGVTREAKAYRGAFRRRDINVGVIGAYSVDPANIEIHVDILYGQDLTDDWKRLVIVKEAIHVFDGGHARVDTPEKLQQLIPSIVSQELRSAPFLPAVNDHFGAFRAMAVLMPKDARLKLAASVESGSRTVEEVASYTKLPEYYVDIWLRYGDQIDPLLFGPV